MHNFFPAGVGIAMVTPFNKENKIDFLAVDKLIKRFLNAKVSYTVLFGTTGEAATLLDSEKKELVKYVSSHYPEMNIVIGVGGNNTSEILNTIDTWKQERHLSIKAILSVTPYYSKPSQEGLFQHYKALASSSPWPIILYNVPGRTAVSMETELIERLSNLPNIIGIKESSGDIYESVKIASQIPLETKFALISGEDTISIPTYSLGACGLISVLGNAFPDVVVDIYNKCQEGDFKTAIQSYSKYLKLTELLFREGNPTGIKLLLSEMGVLENNLRLPLVASSEELKAEIRNQLKIIT